MKRILFFETDVFTGATRVTRTFAKKLKGHFDIRAVIVQSAEDIEIQVRKAIFEVKPDILFSSFVSLNPDVIRIGKEDNHTVVVRQDYNLKDLPIDIQNRVIELYPKADWVIAQTPEMKKELLSLESLRYCRIKVIDNPIDEEEILLKAAMSNPFEDNGNFHFLWVGRRDPVKDLATLHNAYEIVHSQYPQTDLTLVSDDPNPYRWIKNADCLVISSISEAYPNVLKEALFLGTKVVSTDCSPTVRRLLPEWRISKVCDAIGLADVMIKVMAS